MKISNSFNAFWRWTHIAEDTVSILMLLVPISLVSLSIVTRIIIQYENPAWEEIARFTSLWMYMIGVAIASRENSHLNMGLLHDRLSSARGKLILDIINDIFMLVIFCIFFWWAYEDISRSIARGESSLILRVGMWTVRSSFLAGSFLSALHIIKILTIHTRQLFNENGGSK